MWTFIKNLFDKFREERLNLIDVFLCSVIGLTIADTGNYWLFALVVPFAMIGGYISKPKSKWGE